MSVIAVVICPECGESTDVEVREGMGATTLIPDVCPQCNEPWPIDILNDRETTIYD